MEASNREKTNGLINEKSPYLLEHAHNPVDWYTWGDQAFAKARYENKPIFLSIGYSACHWCHRMASECFENEDIARILNEHFVSIKVDREERPDVDEVYMKSVQAMTGSGGWPLSVFLTPDLKPFFGGTYFPPEPGHGLPSFPQVLSHVLREWEEKRGEVEANAQEITAFLNKSYAVVVKETPSESLLEMGLAALISSYDSEYGGFGGAPKFPLPSYLLFLHRYHFRTGKELALKASLRTLEAMSAGGVRDHLAGGFHRYSTDRRWIVPHFEKMLYDNALLARAYLEAYQITRREDLARVVREVLSWIQREMTSPEGGFYSSQDADSEEGEGVYYTWTPEEVRAVLGQQEAELFCKHYGVSSQGNFEGRRSILNETTSLEITAPKLKLSVTEASRILAEARRLLLQARNGRPRPRTDDKILTSWNGLAISAFAYAYQALNDESLLHAAERAAEFVLTRLRDDGQLFRRFRDGETAIPATLEDYAFLVQGLLDLYEASFSSNWLQNAISLNAEMIRKLWDTSGGAFYFSVEREKLPAVIKDAYDGPTPSGNSVAASNLLRLSEYTGDRQLKQKAETILQLYAKQMEEQPSAHTYMLSALDFYLSASKEIIIAANTMDAEVMAFAREAQTRFLPNKILAVLVDGEQVLNKSPLVAGKIPQHGKPTVYICENYACRSPITELSELRKSLEVRNHA